MYGKKMHKLYLTIILLTVFLFSSALPVYAHKMLIDLVEPGKVAVFYEAGSFSERTKVIVYDENMNELAQGNLDESGHFSFSQDLNAFIISADDGMGHKVSMQIGDIQQASQQPRSTKFMQVFAVLISMIIISYYFYKKGKK